MSTYISRNLAGSEVPCVTERKTFIFFSAAHAEEKLCLNNNKAFIKKALTFVADNNLGIWNTFELFLNAIREDLKHRE